MDRQRRGESLDVKPSAYAALVQLEPAERGEPADHRIFDTDRGSDEAIADAVEGFPPDLRHERFLDRESEEGSRRIAANPEGKTPVSDVNAAMGDDARSQTVALGPAPVHVERRAVMDGDRYLGRAQLPPLDRAGGAMGERNGANAQTRIELKTARWRARREIDELTADGPAPIRFHRQVPF